MLVSHEQSKPYTMAATTVFTVKTFNAIKRERTVETFEVKAMGQEAVTELRKKVGPRASIVLKGFIINEKFQEADLTSHWARTLVEGKEVVNG